MKKEREREREKKWECTKKEEKSKAVGRRNFQVLSPTSHHHQADNLNPQDDDGSCLPFFAISPLHSPKLQLGKGCPAASVVLNDHRSRKVHTIHLGAGLVGIPSTQPQDSTSRT
jgi:hypothetical protein